MDKATVDALQHANKVAKLTRDGFRQLAREGNAEAIEIVKVIGWTD